MRIRCWRVPLDLLAPLTGRLDKNRWWENTGRVCGFRAFLSMLQLCMVVFTRCIFRCLSMAKDCENVRQSRLGLISFIVQMRQRSEGLLTEEWSNYGHKSARGSYPCGSKVCAAWRRAGPPCSLSACRDDINVCTDGIHQILYAPLPST